MAPTASHQVARLDEGHAAFPDLESAFYDLIAGLDAEPIQVPVRSYNASLNGDDLIGVLLTPTTWSFRASDTGS